MSNDGEFSTSDEPTSIYGKLMGVFDEKSDLESLMQNSYDSAVGPFEVIEGKDGVAILQRWQEVISHLFMGEMEMKMIREYLNALNANQIVFAVPVSSAQLAESLAQTAKACNASNVVYFGRSVVTNF